MDWKHLKRWWWGRNDSVKGYMPTDHREKLKVVRSETVTMQINQRWWLTQRLGRPWRQPCAGLTGEGGERKVEITDRSRGSWGRWRWASSWNRNTGASWSGSYRWNLGTEVLRTAAPPDIIHRNEINNALQSTRLFISISRWSLKSTIRLKDRLIIIQSINYKHLSCYTFRVKIRLNSTLIGGGEGNNTNLILGREKLSSDGGLFPVNGQFEDTVAVVAEDGSFWIVDAESLRRQRITLDGPLGDGHSRLVQSFRQASASGEDVQRVQRLHRRPARPFTLWSFPKEIRDHSISTKNPAGACWDLKPSLRVLHLHAILSQ